MQFVLTLQQGYQVWHIEHETHAKTMNNVNFSPYYVQTNNVTSH